MAAASISNFFEAFIENLRCIFIPPCLRDVALGAHLKVYVQKLCQGNDATLTKRVEEFRETIEKSCDYRDPYDVMNEIRHFISKVKYYVITNGGDKYQKMRIQEIKKAAADGGLDEDYILEVALYEVIVLPLQKHVCRLLIKQYMMSGALVKMVKNMQGAGNLSLQDFGVTNEILPPSKESMREISNILNSMRNTENIYSKRKILVELVEFITDCIKTTERKQAVVGADDLLPVLAWTLANLGMTNLEVEADLMRFLLPTHLVEKGMGGFCISLLESAIMILKNLHTQIETSTGKGGIREISLSFDKMLVIVIADDSKCLIYNEMLTISHKIKVEEICRLLAKKFRVNSPSTFCLYELTDENELILVDNTRNRKNEDSVFIFKKKTGQRPTYPTQPNNSETNIWGANCLQATSINDDDMSSFEIIDLVPFPQVDLACPKYRCVTKNQPLTASRVDSRANDPSEKSDILEADDDALCKWALKLSSRMRS